MNRLHLWQHADLLRSYFPESQVKTKGDDVLTWIGRLQPTPLSNVYTVKILYSSNKGLSVHVLEPKLILAKGCNRLPHVYNNELQKLCLFYPENREWNRNMWIAKTIVPWASEWLYFYEMWLLTDGQWLGGGITHQQEDKKDNDTGNSIKDSDGTK